MNWFQKWYYGRNTKKYLKLFLSDISDRVIVKDWEHNFLGDKICSGKSGFYGWLSGLRIHNFCTGFCDLQDMDVYIMDVSRTNNEIRSGKKYDIGLFVNVRYCQDPPDMFFASYLRLGFADSCDWETIKKLANLRIKNPLNNKIAI